MPIKINKKYGYTASISKNTNKVIACSKANWEPVRDGSFILLDKDDTFYKVTHKRKFIFQKNVQVLNAKELKIEDLVGTMLAVDDDISLEYVDYTISQVEIVDSGKGYKVGDTLTPSTGMCKYNSIDQVDSPAQIIVTGVGDDGEISSIELTNGGTYSNPPNDVSNVSSNLGTGATLKLVNNVTDIISIEDRTIASIDLKDSDTILHLNHELPPRLTHGQIKVEKWELTLNNDYGGESKYSVNYEIIKDFTPHNDIPLIYGDLSSSHLLYNEAMSIIDQRLKDLENNS
tara:strand:+ start:197 stop:1060 length:864 start_codon:yes stop_codon:yes gene_type:complete